MNDIRDVFQDSTGDLGHGSENCAGIASQIEIPV